jgi:AcrR family transcriptional regulator
MPKVVDIEQRRAELTEAAARLIARSGIESATMREVAAEAGWTTGALTHYFADKRELLLTTFQASLTNRRAHRPADADASPAAQLRASLDGALPLDEARRRHWMVTIAFCAQAAGDPELAEAQRGAYREFRNHVATLAVRCGLTGRRDAQRYAERLIAHADGIAVQALFDEQSWPPERQLAQLDDLLAPLAPGASGAADG